MATRPPSVSEHNRGEKCILSFVVLTRIGAWPGRIVLSVFGRPKRTTVNPTVSTLGRHRENTPVARITLIPTRGKLVAGSGVKATVTCPARVAVIGRQTTAPTPPRYRWNAKHESCRRRRHGCQPRIVHKFSMCTNRRRNGHCSAVSFNTSITSSHCGDVIAAASTFPGICA